MTETEIEPLFSPAGSLTDKARFICNIGGELSLWVMDTYPPNLCIYGADRYGIWLESEGVVQRCLDRMGSRINTRTLEAIARNQDAIFVYMRMLKGAQP